MDHIRRDQTPQFSQPFSQILTMLAIVGGVMGLGYLAYPSVGPTFWANPYLNAFILFVFLIGVGDLFSSGVVADLLRAMDRRVCQPARGA
jgi:hypothetical protein